MAEKHTTTSNTPRPARPSDTQESPGQERRERPQIKNVRPSEFMRARHPDLFSDTRITEHAYLDRAVFDHYLETLTSRKQELAFERFARKLAEKEICPNLIPQTGPTGGGDSKVDSETYPVADEVAARWYEGQAQEAAAQRWAFAFSTKKAWKAKAKADVASAVGTGRGYARVYFITSCYVRDKDRGETQDQLRAQHGIDVQILDRTWILEKVFTNKREQLAIDNLDLARPLTTSIVKGPRDTRRETELQELEREINDPTRYHGIKYQLVEDCLEAALLARGLERPRFEIEGRLERACRIAQKHGTRQQQLRVAYNKAWTLYWWYEDYTAFNEAYAAAEALAQGTLQAEDTNLLKNLWQLLQNAVWAKALSPEVAKIADRTTTLKRELKRLEDDHARPTNALQAKSQALMIRLIESAAHKGEIKTVLREFTTIFEQSRGLINFPTRELINLLMEIGEAFPSQDAFDDTFEAVLEVARERDGDATAGQMLLRRGMQKIEGGEPYQALRLLGRAQQHLGLRETRHELVAALALCSRAYEAAGLLWAARGSMLLAANQALQDFWEEGQFTRQAYACLRRLAWIDLQLCRVPYVLAWIEATALFRTTMKLDTEQEAALRDEWLNLDFALGVLLLRTDLFDLKNTGTLPASFKRLGLVFSRTALLYALGHEERLREENMFSPEDGPQEVQAMFTEAARRTEEGDLGFPPDYLDRRKVMLQSTVLGCNVKVEAPNEDRPLFLAEALLAGLEAFLATSLDSNLLPFAPTLTLTILSSDLFTEPLEWTVVEHQRLIEVRYSTASAVDQGTLQERLAKLVLTITLEIAVPIDAASMETLVRDEQALGRAVGIMRVSTAIGNILGPKPKIRLSDWDTLNAEAFALRRADAWNAGQERPAPEQQGPIVFGTGDPPPGLLNTEALKHRDRQVFSVINIPLWDKAEWQGTGFIGTADLDMPPLLALAFKDKEAGKKIFAGWREDIGRHDRAGKLRISIITGIDRRHPAHYRVIVGANLDSAARAPNTHFAMVSRVLTVNPKTSENLDRFLRNHRHVGSYYLVPGHIVPGKTIPEFSPELAIHTSHLNVRPAWEIPEHDPDVIGLQADDDIIVPEGIKAPPVLRTLELIKKRRHEVHTKSASFYGAKAKTQAKIGRNDPCHCGSGKKFKKCHGQ